MRALVAFAFVATIGVAACRDYDVFATYAGDLGAADGATGGEDLGGPSGDLGCRAPAPDAGSFMGAFAPMSSDSLMANATAMATIPVQNVVLGDFDGDGVADLVTGASYLDTDVGVDIAQLAVLPGVTSGGRRSFKTTAVFTQPDLGRLLIAADFDRTGPAELVFSSLSMTNATLTIGRLTEHATVTPLQILKLPGPAVAGRALDVDRDGVLDLVVSYDASANGVGRLRVYWGRPQGSIPPFDDTQSGYAEVGGQSAQLAILLLADLDGDCQPELVASSSAGALSVVDVGANRTLSAEALGAAPWTGAIAGLAAGDFDGDGHDELFVARSTSGTTAHLLLRAAPSMPSGPRFAVTPIPLVQAMVAPTGVDLDGNGVDELVFWSGDGSLSALRFLPTPAAVSLAAAPGSVPGSLANPPLFADLDLDGKIDVVWADFLTATLPSRSGQ